MLKFLGATLIFESNTFLKIKAMAPYIQQGANLQQNRTAAGPARPSSDLATFKAVVPRKKRMCLLL
jgi:hypothetical protein